MRETKCIFYIFSYSRRNVISKMFQNYIRDEITHKYRNRIEKIHANRFYSYVKTKMQDHKTQVFTITFYEYLSLFYYSPWNVLSVIYLLKFPHYREEHLFFDELSKCLLNFEIPSLLFQYYGLICALFCCIKFFPNTFIFTLNLFQFRITYTRYGLWVLRYAVEMKVWVYPFGHLLYPVRQFAYNSVKFIREYHRLTSCIWYTYLI